MTQFFQANLTILKIPATLSEQMNDRGLQSDPSIIWNLPAPAASVVIACLIPVQS